MRTSRLCRRLCMFARPTAVLSVSLEEAPSVFMYSSMEAEACTVRVGRPQAPAGGASLWSMRRYSRARGHATHLEMSSSPPRNRGVMEAEQDVAH